jgi:hypothetical protein
VDQQRTTAPLRFFGRVFSTSDIQLITEITIDFPSLSLEELSRTICELLDWKRPNGRLKSLECRQMLVSLGNQGLLTVPETLNRGLKGPRVVTLTGQSAARVTEESATPTISDAAASLEPLTLKLVKGRSSDSRQWRELIARHHYIGWRPHVGANLRYLVLSARYPDRPLACLLWTSAAWKIEVRDQWIGWTSETRARNLQFIVNNSRFLVLPWVRVAHLASKIIGRCARQLPTDWERMYGYRPLLLESFVDSMRFRGTCYRAANWILLGETKGRGRMDRLHSEANAPKLVYVYPLGGNAIERLCGDVGPSWDGSRDPGLIE